jgi:hypothetical protein
MSAQQTPVCGHWSGARRAFCGYPHGVKYFVIGWRCAVHTPAKVREWAEEQARTAAGDAS